MDKKKFSERYGYKKISDVIQFETISSKLKTRIWNLILTEFIYKLYDTPNRYYVKEETERGEFYKKLWSDFFYLNINEIPKNGIGTFSNLLNTSKIESFVSNKFVDFTWDEVYDLLEFCIQYQINTEHEDLDIFIQNCNNILEDENSGYRILNYLVTPVTNQVELSAIENTLTKSNSRSVKTHLSKSIEYLSSRDKPDYRNSIKESISAVESYCKMISNNDKDSLGEALEKIDKKHKIHGALKSAFKSIYGYTSDAGGIRHSLLENDAEVSMEDARFMLICCSAFINYLMQKLDK